MKKLLAALIVVMMAVALLVPAFAANQDPHTITITNTDSSVQHTYEAYQVFNGDLDQADSVLSNIQWGTGVDGAALLAELQTMADFANCQSARDVAAVVAGYGNNSAKLDDFARVVGNNLSNVKYTSNQTSSPYNITVIGDGYYFVKDKDGTVTAPSETYSKYMLNVVKDVSIEAKDDHEPPKKNIIEANTPVNANAASIGDEITYRLEVPMPKMDGYKAYKLTMNDTMSKGLTYKSLQSVTIGSTPATEGEDYTITVTENADGTTDIVIDFINFISHKGETGFVTATYVATLNEDAKIGVEGNPNTFDVEYSNNPASTDEGEPGDTGITPKSTVITYSTGVKILKVDGADNTKVLEGAKFKIEGNKLNIVVTTGTKFEKQPYTPAADDVVDPEIYYQLQDGTYATPVPAGYTDDTYVLVHFKTVTQTSAAVNAEGTTGPDGLTNFDGLNAGTYTLTELQSPDGYNLLDAPITFEITWDETNGFAVAANDQSGVTYNAQTGTFEITIENNEGAVLPHTGGIGTTIFTVVGAVLAVGAAVALVSVVVSRRKEENN